MLTTLWELIRKDLKVFFADPKAVLISFLVPVGIASFMALAFGNAGNSDAKQTTKIQIAVANEDSGPVADDAMDRLLKSDQVTVKEEDWAAVQKDVKAGTLPYGVRIPKGFGDQAVATLGSDNKGPDLPSTTDPSQTIASQVARGAIMQAVMGSIVKAKYGAMAGSGAPPFHETAVAADNTAPAADANKWDGVAHSFTGMGVQGLLFWSIESAMGILRERKQGIWRRLRASPVSPGMLLLGKILSGAIRAVSILAAVFGVGALVFHMHFAGSFIGFLLVAVCAALMASAFGMFVASLGRTEQQSRGLSVLAVLLMMMLGGAWFPAFLMPQWVQQVALAIPVRWIVEGFDAMTWRGQALSQAMPFVGVILAFAAAFGVIALRRMRWEYEA